MFFKQIKSKTTKRPCNSQHPSAGSRTPRWILSCLCILLLGTVTLSCAKQGYPNGGPKDTQPPVIERITPPSNTLNFADPKFQIYFDEYIQLKDAENNILVSPPMKHKPEYTVKGKRLDVVIKDTLKHNTTYLFQFKNAIVDFTEGNPLPSLEYAFSTGEYIDSLQISGQVTDAQTYKPSEKTITVALYPDDSTWNDSTVFLCPPAYITRCGKQGDFTFSHIGGNRFHIIALEDADHNLKYNGNEAIAFAESIVEAKVLDTIDSTQNNTINMRLFAANTDKQRITKSQYINHGRIEIITQVPVDRPNIHCNDSLFWSLAPTKDTLNIWMYNEKCDSTTLVVTDPSGINDTLTLRFKEKKNKKKEFANRGSNSSKLITHHSPSSIGYFDTIFVTTSNPISTVNDSLIRIVNTKDSTRLTASTLVAPDQLNIILVAPIKGKQSYKVTIPQGTIHDIYGHANDSISFPIDIRARDQYGSIFCKVTADDCDNPTATLPPLLLQLTDEKGTIKQSKPWEGLSNKVCFANIVPGKYKLQLLKDINNDGLWTTGDYLLHRQPEQILFLEKTFEVRENWDIEETWNTGCWIYE